MGDEKTTSWWVQFFTEAGIPPRAAANYAVVFQENRIQSTMLLDLNKEYLKDMGVTILGDVIAILKQAKIAHEKAAREKILPDKVSLIPKISPVTRVLKNLKTDVTEDVYPKPKKVVPKTATAIATRPAPKIAVRKLIKTITQPAKEETITPMTPKAKPTSLALAKAQSVESDLEELALSPGEEVPVRKKRRVLPEHEGGYKIIMPAGTTPKTQRILASQSTQVAKKSVFDRLGDSSVTSTTGSDTESSNDKQSSIFHRLGGIEKITPVKTLTRAPSQGTLRSIEKPFLREEVPIVKTPVIKRLNPFDEGQPVKKMIRKLEPESVSTNGLKHRLGDSGTNLKFKTNLKSPSSTLRKFAKPINPVNSNVKERLGTRQTVSKSVPVVSGKNVFSRLGAK